MEYNGTIELEGMEFHAYHGVLESEKKEGNTFVVDFMGQFNPKKAIKTDDISKTIDYSKVYDIVAEEMDKPSNLIENVAGRIAKRIIDEFEFWYVRIRVSKKNPPVNGVCAWSRTVVSVGDNLNEDFR